MTIQITTNNITFATLTHIFILKIKTSLKDANYFTNNNSF
jgi:hypothetical protein